MSLPPLAPPPAPRLPPRKKKKPLLALTLAAPGKGLMTPTTAAKAPVRGRGGPPTEHHHTPFASSALQRQLLLPRSPGAQQKSRRQQEDPPAQPQAGAAAAQAPLSRARPLLGSPCLGLRPAGQSLSSATPRRFSLSLPPEALRVLQRRSLQQPQRPGGPAAAAKQRPLAGGSGDLRALLQVSLLNERRRGDNEDVEEEEGEGDPGVVSSPPTHDEGLVRKCTEWLRGVESAAARDRPEKLETLPHLS